MCVSGSLVRHVCECVGGPQRWLDYLDGGRDQPTNGGVAHHSAGIGLEIGRRRAVAQAEFEIQSQQCQALRGRLRT